MKLSARDDFTEIDSTIDHIIYLDEAGRGSLAGNVFVGAVVWSDVMKDDTYTEIKDSKKLTKKKRGNLVRYIEDTAVSFSVKTATVKEIDDINILQATYLAMHRAIDDVFATLPKSANADNVFICVDGNSFKPYMYQGEFVSHICIPKGDDKYTPIAAASILAKVYHDRSILKLCENDPKLDEKYGWSQNMCYGTKKHIQGIEQYGITSHHRTSFGICKKFI